MKLTPRYLAWVNLVLLALLAYWGASTVSTAIAARLMSPPAIKLTAPPPPLVKEPNRPATHYAIIYSRDLFNSTKPEAPKVAEPPKPSECKAKLWGVVVHLDETASYAIIEDLSTRKQELYRINEAAAGCGTVKRVEWDRVVLDRDGSEVILELAPPAGGSPVTRGGTAVAAAGARGGRGDTADGHNADAHGAGAGVQKVSETEYNIDKREVDSALDNMNQLLTQVRAVPHFEGGKATGFRLFAIRQNSIFDQIGLRNGDIIQRINGTEINDPGKALGLFNELRDQRQLVVEIVRNRESKTLSYNIN
jgi:general secretion pathway protein C